MTLTTVVPVLARPEKIAPFVANHHATTPGELVFVCDPDDERSVAAVRAVDSHRVRLEVLPTAKLERFGRGTWAMKVNQAIRETRADWILCAADDVELHPGWWEATEALRAIPDIGVIGTNDLKNPRVIAGTHATHPLVRRTYVESRGTVDGPGLAHEGYGHWYVDDEIIQTAKARRAWAPCPDAIVEHHHPMFDENVPDDATYAAGMSSVEADRDLWDNVRQPLVYAAGEPFPHMVLDFALDPSTCSGIVREIPDLTDERWKHFVTDDEEKYEGSDPSMWGELTRAVIDALSAGDFRSFLGRLTGIPNLVASTYGGGFHVIDRGGFLNRHVDFNVVNDDQGTPWYRRLNLLVFLNTEWKASWGGVLELGDTWKQMVLPAPMGRIVIFTTSEHSLHGHPVPVTGPHLRRSLALYYYTMEAPDSFTLPHSTVFG